MRRILAAVLASVLGHALVLAEVRPGAAASPGAAELDEAARFGPRAAQASAAAARAGRLSREREALVARARVDRDAGRIELGRFLLAANRIDAELLGQPFDHVEAETRYLERLAALRDALEDGSARRAVPEAFGDLRYYGEPGGLMGNALLEGGGSCEQVAQLVVAAAYDAGQREGIELRYYGGVMSDGATHLAPVAVEPAGAHDLMSGRPAVRGGTRVAAEELVEAYARAHGLAPPHEPLSRAGDSGASTGGASAFGASNGRAAREAPAQAGSPRPSIVAGLPDNDDRFPGTLPLYAARAVHDPGGDEALGDEGGAPDVSGSDCAYFLRTGALSPPRIELSAPAEARGGREDPGANALALEPRFVPAPARLERMAAMLRAAGDLATDPSAHAADRLMGWACLAALGDSAAVDMTLAGERRLATTATARAHQARERGRETIAAALGQDGGTTLRARLASEFGGRTWLLLFLEGGDDLMLDLVRGARREEWGRVSALAALVLWPETRARAMPLVEALPLRDQVGVMHEVFHAHDHMRPWASNVALDAGTGDSGTTFLRVYGVFRGLGFRLWEGQRPVEEILAGLSRDSRRAGLDPAWEAALLDYLGGNILGLHSHRPSGLAVVARLKKAAAESGHPSLDVLRRRLSFIESESRLDARTLADAWRLE